MHNDTEDRRTYVVDVYQLLGDLNIEFSLYQNLNCYWTRSLNLFINIFQPEGLISILAQTLNLFTVSFE